MTERENEMNAPLQTSPPDVETIDKLTDLNEVNARLKSHGWVLLGLPITRLVGDGGSFSDKPAYIIGKRRGT